MDKLKELKFRRAVAQALVNEASKITDDDRAKEAVRFYTAQRDEIQEEITKLESKPAPTVVGLKTAVLTAKSK